MAFTSKNLQYKKSGMSFIKGATLFFLGMSAVLFLTQAFNISPSTTNRSQVIRTIIFTDDGTQDGATGALIDGDGGNAYFAGNVGIGVNSPVSRLHINGEMRSNSIYVDTPDGVSIGDKYIGGLNEVQGIFFQDGTSLSDVIAAKMLAVGRLLAGDNIRVTTGGNVGIGTTGPNQKFEVAGNMRFTTNGYLEAGTNPNQLYLKNNGNIGIGTNNPSEKLEIAGNIELDHENTSDRKIQMEYAGGASAIYGLYVIGSNAMFSALGHGSRGGNVYLKGGFGSNGTTSGGPGGNVYINGGNGGTPGGAYGDVILANDGGQVQVGNSLNLYSDPVYSTIQATAQLQFNTSGVNPRITINSVGNVGIGTTTPSTKLHVAGITKIDSSVQIWNEAGNARCNGTGDRGKMVYINMCYATGGNLIYTPTFLGCVGSGENGYFKKAFMTGASWTKSGSTCLSIYEGDEVISQAGDMIRFN